MEWMPDDYWPKKLVDWVPDHGKRSYSVGWGKEACSMVMIPQKSLYVQDERESSSCRRLTMDGW